MKTLKQIYVENCRKAGFTEKELPLIFKVTLDKWLTQKRMDTDKDWPYLTDFERLGREKILVNLIEEINC